MPRAAPGPHGFEQVLERLAVDAASHFGVTDRVRLRVEHRESRPASYVARIEAQFGDASQPPRRLFAKVFKVTSSLSEADLATRVSHEFTTLERLHRAMQTDDGGVVPPVAHYPDLLALVTEEVEGDTLLDYLPRAAAWFPGATRLAPARVALGRLGRWLRTFQATEPPGAPTTFAALRDYIDVRLTRLVREGPRRFDPAWQTALLSHIDRLGRELSAAELVQVPIHSDLALGNVLVSGDRIVVLDFAMARTGMRLHDLTRAALQIDLLSLKPHIGRSATTQLRTALMEGFDPGLHAGAPAFRLLTLLHRVNNLATLLLRPLGLKERPFAALVRRNHEAWLAAEVTGGHE